MHAVTLLPGWTVRKFVKTLFGNGRDCMQHATEAYQQHVSEEFVADQAWLRANLQNVIDPEWLPAFCRELDSHTGFPDNLKPGE